MDQEKIERINALARKSRTAEGLTEAEKAEQQALRQEYLDAVRRNFKAQLEGIQVLEPDGKVHPLGPKRNGGKDA